jgi:hypothetical protein
MTPWQRMRDEPRQPKRDRRKRDSEPPGDFLSDDLREATTRFLHEVKRQIEQRREVANEPRLGPPRRSKH